jgi:anti-sigma factor RsiW
MLTVSCEQVRTELSAYHDEELPITESIAIADHLAACPACAVEADDLRAMSEAFRASGRIDDVAWMPGSNRLQSDVLQRWEAEENASLASRIRRLFDDPRRASASVGVSLVTSFLVAFGALMIAQGPGGDPESLRAVMSQVSRASDIYLPALSVQLPRAHVDAVMPAAFINRDGTGESVAFAALVTEDGELAELEYLGEQTRRGYASRPATHDQLSQLLNAAATARFEPARIAGAPVSLNVVWLVTHRTVRPTLHAYVHVTVDGFRL